MVLLGFCSLLFFREPHCELNFPLLLARLYFGIGEVRFVTTPKGISFWIGPFVQAQIVISDPFLQCLVCAETDVNKSGVTSDGENAWFHRLIARRWRRHRNADLNVHLARHVDNVVAQKTRSAGGNSVLSKPFVQHPELLVDLCEHSPERCLYADADIGLFGPLHNLWFPNHAVPLVLLLKVTTLDCPVGGKARQYRGVFPSKGYGPLALPSEPELSQASNGRGRCLSEGVGIRHTRPGELKKSRESSRSLATGVSGRGRIARKHARRDKSLKATPPNHSNAPLAEMLCMQCLGTGLDLPISPTVVRDVAGCNMLRAWGKHKSVGLGLGVKSPACFRVEKDAVMFGVFVR